MDAIPYIQQICSGIKEKLNFDSGCFWGQLQPRPNIFPFLATFRESHPIFADCHKYRHHETYHAHAG